MSKKQKPWEARREEERQAREQRRQATQIVLDKLPTVIPEEEET